MGSFIRLKMNPEDADLNSLIVDSFKGFIAKKNILDLNELNELFDDAIASYVVNTIRQLYDDYETHKTWLDIEFAETFDVENFVEIIDEYLNGFKGINMTEITNWLIQLKSDINDLNNRSKEPKCESNKLDKDDLPGIKMESNIKMNNPDLELLCEMFPLIELSQISKVYKMTSNNYERAIDELLLNQHIPNQNNYVTAEEKQLIKEKTVQKYVE